MDAGAALACPTGSVCVEGRCYDECTVDSDCGPREECGRDGVCVRSGGPQPDGAVRTDAGPEMPCDGVTCDAPEVCHPLSGQCVACTEERIGAMEGLPGVCASGTTCDIANGTCGAPSASQCAACNSDTECDDGTFMGACVTRDVLGWREQVCMQICTAGETCPGGTACDGTHCVPVSGVSCTTWNRAVTRSACFGDADCNIAGTSGAGIFFVDTCNGYTPPVIPDAGMDDASIPDAGMGTAGRCLLPCGSVDDCFDMAGGQTCTNTGRFTFCVDP